LKILFVAPRFHTNQSTIVKTLISNGHKVFFHVYTIGPIEDHSVIKPVIIDESILSKLRTQIFGDKSKNRKNYFPSIIKYYLVFKEISPDIMIIRRHGRIYSYWAAICGRITNTKIIFYDQINSKFLYTRHHKSLRSYLNKLKFLSTLKLFNAAWFTPLHNSDQKLPLPNRCYYLPFAVDVKIDKEFKINNPIRLLMTGKYYKRKNHQLLIEALEKIKDDYEFHLTLVGEVSNNTHRNRQLKIKDLVRKVGIENKIEFLDNIPFNKMESIYISHDLFLLPASNEPASISVLEAMGYGLPVICSDTCGTKTYIKQNNNGNIFKSDNSQSLAKIISNYLDNNEYLFKQKKWLLENANSEISADNYLICFNSLIETEKAYGR
jgi:glycosyltransferase involved in cell wall biosynthesis